MERTVSNTNPKFREVIGRFTETQASSSEIPRTLVCSCGEFPLVVGASDSEFVGRGDQRINCRGCSLSADAERSMSKATIRVPPELNREIAEFWFQLRRLTEGFYDTDATEAKVD